MTANLGATPELSRFSELELRRRELEAELKVVEQEQDTLQPTILEQFVNSGVSKVTLNGLTLYIHSQLWAGVDRQDGETDESAYARACEKLKEMGLDDYVQTRFNSQSLSAYFRELVKLGASLEGFEGAIKVAEKTKIAARKAA